MCATDFSLVVRSDGPSMPVIPRPRVLWLSLLAGQMYHCPWVSNVGHCSVEDYIHVSSLLLPLLPSLSLNSNWRNDLLLTTQDRTRTTSTSRLVDHTDHETILLLSDSRIPPSRWSQLGDSASMCLRASRSQTLMPHQHQFSLYCSSFRHYHICSSSSETRNGGTSSSSTLSASASLWLES